ncbi:uncharacterized protein LOC111071498 [Drosophila obscura]|uniref:uncharacterized protein LOC111071498 n=1 Tax=Drosophila obscura TaxID=7282 RepID=UPI000BA16200|nr:uncharacterized protein LOC111071498 [Drosophila obscura]
MFKFRDIVYFVILTGLRVCAEIQPTVEAHAKLNWNNLTVDRSLRLNVGYLYQPSMLLRAMMYSLLTLIGLWYGRQRDAVRRAKRRQELAEHRARSKSIISSPSSQWITAQQVMNEWVRRRKEASITEIQVDAAALDMELEQSEGSYFPWMSFLLFALPWTWTFVVTGMVNYGRLHLVLQHFCLTYWQTVMLYLNIQMMFLRRIIEASLASYWQQFHGTVEDPSIKHINYISFETHLLSME